MYVTSCIWNVAFSQKVYGIINRVCLNLFSFFKNNGRGSVGNKLSPCHPHYHSPIKFIEKMFESVYLSEKAAKDNFEVVSKEP